MHLASEKNTSLSRCLLAGLVCGLITAFLNVTYAYFYRRATDFIGYKVIEPLLIFIAFPLLFIIAGLIFFEMVENIKKGRLLFTMLFLLLMLIAIIFDLSQSGKGIE